MQWKRNTSIFFNARVLYILYRNARLLKNKIEIVTYINAKNIKRQSAFRTLINDISKRKYLTLKQSRIMVEYCETGVKLFL